MVFERTHAIERRGVTISDNLSIREKELFQAVTGISGPRIPFPLDRISDNRRVLQLGDIILAENTDAKAQLGFLVVQGKGWKAQCAPLFCLVHGQPVFTADKEPDLHDLSNRIKPHISYMHKSLRPTDGKGRNFLFPTTAATIIRPANKKLRDKIEEFYSADFLSRHMLKWSLPAISVFGGREILIAATQMLSGVVMANKDIMDDAILLGIGSAMYWGAGKCYDRAKNAHDEVVNMYANQFPNGNLTVRQAIKEAFLGSGSTGGR